MEKDAIIILLMGILSIGMAIFGKIRPDILYRSWRGVEIKPEGQRLGFVMLLLFGIMIILVSVVMSIPQWQDYGGTIAVTVVMAMTIVMLFFYWKIMLSQNEKWRTIGMVAFLLLSIALIALNLYYWHITLK
jgi:hypothetical protein